MSDRNAQPSSRALSAVNTRKQVRGKERRSLLASPSSKGRGRTGRGSRKWNVPFNAAYASVVKTICWPFILATVLHWHVSRRMGRTRSQKTTGECHVPHRSIHTVDTRQLHKQALGRHGIGTAYESGYATSECRERGRQSAPSGHDEGRGIERDAQRRHALLPDYERTILLVKLVRIVG